jgi:hypothetical protein
MSTIGLFLRYSDSWGDINEKKRVLAGARRPDTVGAFHTFFARIALKSTENPNFEMASNKFKI